MAVKLKKKAILTFFYQIRVILTALDSLKLILTFFGQIRAIFTDLDHLKAILAVKLKKKAILADLSNLKPIFTDLANLKHHSYQFKKILFSKMLRSTVTFLPDVFYKTKQN